MQNIISCRPESFGQYRDRALESLQRLGLKYVEIQMPAPDRREQTRQELEQHGLQTASVAFYARVQDPDFLERVREAVDTAVSLGANVMFTSQHAKETPLEHVYHSLRKAGEIAAHQNVTIALETHPDLCQNSTQALQTMQGIDHPNVRINFDPANVHYYNEGVDAVTELARIAPYVRAVHLKDTNGGFQTWHFPAIGEGVVDWPEVFRIVGDQGLNGPFTLEMEGIEGESLTFEETYGRIEQSLAYLRANGLMQ